MTEATPSPCGTRFPAVIEHAFVGRVRPRAWRALLVHVDTCAGCRDKLERLGLVDEALARDAPLPPRVRERIGARVLAQVEPRAARDARGRRTQWALGMALAGALAAVLLLVVRPDPRPHPSLRPRGAGDPNAAARVYSGRRAPARLFDT